MLFLFLETAILHLFSSSPQSYFNSLFRDPVRSDFRPVIPYSCPSEVVNDLAAITSSKQVLFSFLQITDFFIQQYDLFEISSHFMIQTALHFWFSS